MQKSLSSLQTHLTRASAVWVLVSIHCEKGSGSQEEEHSSGPLMCINLLIDILFGISLLNPLSLFSVLILSKCYFKVINAIIMMFFCITVEFLCYFLLSCYTMSKTCDHFTASGKHV